MDARKKRPRGDRTVRTLVNRMEQHQRLQRELLWHPRLGLVGTRQGVPAHVVLGERPRWTRR